MNQNDLKNTVLILESLNRLESKIAELYRECADAWPEDEDFWRSLYESEIDHCRYIVKMTRIIQERPHLFKVEKPPHQAAVKTVISGIDENIKRVKERRIPYRNILNVAWDIEMSILERKFIEVAASWDAEYNSLADRVRAETEEHRQKIHRKRSEHQKQ